MTKLIHRIVFDVDKKVMDRLQKLNIEPRVVFLHGLENVELKLSQGFKFFERSLPGNKRLRKIYFVLEEEVQDEK